MINIKINNNQTLKVFQSEESDCIKVQRYNSKNEKVNGSVIEIGDFLMLINYHSYIKENDIQCDFINPNGKNKD